MLNLETFALDLPPPFEMIPFVEPRDASFGNGASSADLDELQSQIGASTGNLEGHLTLRGLTVSLFSMRLDLAATSSDLPLDAT